MPLDQFSWTEGLYLATLRSNNWSGSLSAVTSNSERAAGEERKHVSSCGAFSHSKELPTSLLEGRYVCDAVQTPCSLEVHALPSAGASSMIFLLLIVDCRDLLVVGNPNCGCRHFKQGEIFSFCENGGTSFPACPILGTRLTPSTPFSSSQHVRDVRSVRTGGADIFFRAAETRRGSSSCAQTLPS